MLEPQGFMGHDDGFAFSLPQRENSYGVDCYGRVNLYLGIFCHGFTEVLKTSSTQCGSGSPYPRVLATPMAFGGAGDGGFECFPVGSEHLRHTPSLGDAPPRTEWGIPIKDFAYGSDSLLE